MLRLLSNSVKPDGPLSGRVPPSGRVVTAPAAPRSIGRIPEVLVKKSLLSSLILCACLMTCGCGSSHNPGVEVAPIPQGEGERVKAEAVDAQRDQGVSDAGGATTGAPMPGGDPGGASTGDLGGASPGAAPR